MTPLIRFALEVDLDGETVAEEVALTEADFEEATLAEIDTLKTILDPEVYDRLGAGEMAPESLLAEPGLLRSLLYAKLRPRVRNRALRAALTVEDVDVSLDDLTRLAAAF